MSGPRIHFVGIGGVGMAGLARLYAQEGALVSGSDVAESRLTRELVELGVEVRRGHATGHVPTGVDWGVRTPAVEEGNPEVATLRGRGVPVYARGVVLADYANRRRALAVAGAHGKTTTSAMLAHVLRANGVPCGYAIGGETSLPGSVADRGASDWFVLEADESDGTLVEYAPEVAVLSCVEWDHIERFPTEDALLACYRRFAGRAGCLWFREDDPLAGRVAVAHPRARRAGVSTQADLRLLETRDTPGGQVLRVQWQSRTFEGTLPLPGLHNAWNALLALGAASETGLDPRRALAALADFRSVARRFDRIEIAGRMLVHDYAHHPTELRALLASARSLAPRRLRLAFQPHRYSRTQHLLDPFADALAEAGQLDLLPVYAASELPSQGVDSEALAACIHQRHPRLCPRLWKDPAALAGDAAAWLQPGDLFIVAGAGDIEQVFHAVARALSV